MATKAFVREAWPTLKRAILDGLRRSPHPIPPREIGGWCNVSHLMTPAEVQDCLDQLEAKGLVRYTRLGWEAAGRWGGGS